MKTKILFYMALTAVTMTLAACSQDDELQNDAPKPAAIEFEIFDGGYADVQTRAVEDGYRTKFVAGDVCGLYTYSSWDGNMYTNVKLTAEEGDGGKIVWKADDNSVCNMNWDKYFIYYPYRENISNITIGNGYTDTDVFENLISSWTPEKDQSTYANYTASDLMTAEGTATKLEDGRLKISFSMTHRMALAVIEVPRTVYKFTDKSIPAYVPTSVDFTSDIKPLRMADGTYRCIVKPNATEDEASLTKINGKASDGKTFTVTPSEMPAEKYTRFVVGGGAVTEINHNLQVGDCLMTDGTLKPRSEIDESNKDDVAAIVFSVGHNQYDNSDYSSTGIGLKKCHGYAVAKEDATSSKCKWGKYNVELKLYPLDGEGEKINNSTYYYMDWSGYSYTQTIIDKVGGKGNLSTEQDGYPATYYAVVKYPETTSAPATTSGWFLPAVGQMCEVVDKRSILFDSTVGTSLVNRYWSSSEYSDKAENSVMFAGDNGGVGSCDKNVTYFNCIVRAVLAF